MRAALNAIEWPEDELSVYATLSGALFSIPDELLFAYKEQHGRLNPFATPESTPAFTPVVQALASLRKLHRHRNDRPIAETVCELLVETRALAGFALRPSGEQVLANVLRIADLAKEYDERGGASFRGFVQRLKQEAESGETAEAAIVEEGNDGVRIMTVHKAKGLEFAIVIMADLAAKIATSDPSRFLDQSKGLCALRISGLTPLDLAENRQLEISRDAAEGVRLAYVAATRARDLIVVPTIGDLGWSEMVDYWLGPLMTSIYPDVESMDRAVEGPNCPRFGKDSVRKRPDGLSSKKSIRPGLHRLSRDRQVVWWDPHALALDVRQSFSLRQGELLVDEGDDLTAKDLERYRAWKESLVSAQRKGARPQFQPISLTKWAKENAHESASITYLRIEHAIHKPSSPRYGTLVHSILANIDVNGDRPPRENIALVQGRVLGATELEISAAIAVIEALIAAPQMADARRAASRGRMRREIPVCKMLPDGALVEGVIDLAFEDGGRWTVIDLKTDRDMSQHSLEVYSAQVAMYTEAVREATGCECCGLILHV